MVILKNYSLKAFNTFGIDVKGQNLVRIQTEKALQRALDYMHSPVYILGGGSNLLLTKNVEGLILKNEIKGIEIIEEKEHELIIAVGGGEIWHQLVCWAIEHNYGGLENLSLIPGTVGAAPIQNIGAYGIELKDVFVQLEAIHLKTKTKKIFDKAACHFAYRTSIFKQALKGQYFISKVYLRLTKNKHSLNIEYGAIKSTLAEQGIIQPSIKNISDAVITIRSSKLPDPKTLGNSGSFFKNPIIPSAQFEQLQKQFPNIVFYPLENQQVKIPAGWLIEHCGWKGKRIGNTGAHARQALVLVNYGNATGHEIKALAFEIIASIKEKYGIGLSPEVNIW